MDIRGLSERSETCIIHYFTTHYSDIKCDCIPRSVDNRRVTIRRVQVTRTYKRETFGCRKLLNALNIYKFVMHAWWPFLVKNHRPSIASLPGPDFHKKIIFFKNNFL
jgi:hypothetical protein